MKEINNRGAPVLLLLMQPKKIYVISFMTRLFNQYAWNFHTSHMIMVQLARMCTALQKKFKIVRSIFFFCIYATSNISLEHCLLLGKTTLKTHYNHGQNVRKALFCINILACQLFQQLILTFEKKLTVHYTSGLYKDHISELHDQINIQSIPFPKAPSLVLLLLVIL